MKGALRCLLALAALGTGCSQGVPLRELAPPEFHADLGERAEQSYREGETPGRLLPAETTQEASLVDLVSGSLTTLEAEDEHAEVGLYVTIRSDAEGAAPQRMFLAVFPVAPPALGPLSRASPATALVAHSLGADAAALRREPVQKGRTEDVEGVAEADGWSTWTLRKLVSVPRAAVDWDRRRAARFLVRFLIEHANGECSTGVIASTVLEGS